MFETEIIYNPPMDPYVLILYRDNDLLVLDKPSGLLSVPARDPRLADSLSKRVQEKFPTALMINRLDKDTSGLVLMSLNKKTHAEIAKQFENRTTNKTYIAVVNGHLNAQEGYIDLPLGIDANNKPRHKVDYETGKAAQTRWSVIEHLDNMTTRIKLNPLTGRTHQLRVHMQALGHPILGDEFYADEKALSGSNRLLLHAHQLEIEYPAGSIMRFETTCPF